MGGGEERQEMVVDRRKGPHSEECGPFGWLFELGTMPPTLEFKNSLKSLYSNDAMETNRIPSLADTIATFSSGPNTIS